MPASPYIISGTVYDRDRSTALANVTINIINKTWETPISSTSTNRSSVTTNASGQYTFNIANLPNEYNNGDTIAIQAKYTSYSKGTVVQTVVDTTVGTEDIDIYLMDEDIKFGIKSSGNRYLTLKHRKITVGTANTVVIQPIDLSDYENVSLVINNDSSSTLTAKVYVSDDSLHGRCDSTVDNSYWSQSGNDQSIAATSSEHVIWVERPQFVCIVITASTATDEDVHVTLHATTT